MEELGINSLKHKQQKLEYNLKLIEELQIKLNETKIELKNQLESIQHEMELKHRQKEFEQLIIEVSDDSD